MAKETKSTYVPISSESNSIEEWESFGWEVLSSQKCEYNGVDSVKLTFNREKGINNYDKIIELEEQYRVREKNIVSLAKRQNEVRDSVPNKKRFNIILFIGGIWFMGIPSVLYLVFYILHLNKIKKQRSKAVSLYNELEEQCTNLGVEMDGIITQAKALL